MFYKVKTFLIGISGGIDSSVLVQLLTLLASRENKKVVLCHLNHSFRESESDRDEKFVKNLAEKLNVFFESQKVNMPDIISSSKGGSAQSISREKRFEFFESACAKYDTKTLFLAHNLDDLCETFLLRLFKGGGMKGLSSMKMRSSYKDLIINRPLLTVPREDIETYAENFKIEYVEDSSNKSDKYDRNKIRHNILPFIKKEFNNNILHTVENLTDLIKCDEDYFKEVVLEKLNEVLIEKKRKVYVLDLLKFNALHESLKSRILREVLKEIKGSIYDISFNNISDILYIAGLKESKKEIKLSSEIKAKKINYRLIIGEKI